MPKPLETDAAATPACATHHKSCNNTPTVRTNVTHRCSSAWANTRHGFAQDMGTHASTAQDECDAMSFVGDRKEKLRWGGYPRRQGRTKHMTRTHQAHSTHTPGILHPHPPTRHTAHTRHHVRAGGTRRLTVRRSAWCPGRRRICRDMTRAP